MAGIGFELKRALRKESLLSLAKVYGYATLLSSGPWVISIVAILFVGFVHLAAAPAETSQSVFAIIVTYTEVLAVSMIATGFVQLPFTRYIADLIYLGKEEEIFPNYLGVTAVVWLYGWIVVFPLLPLLFPHQGWLFRLGLFATYQMLASVWIANTLAASLKYYRGVIGAFLLSYGMIVLFSLTIGETLNEMIWIFFAGNALLWFLLSVMIAESYASTRSVSFSFFRRKGFYWSLAIAGFFYNFGIWIDKFVFWYHPLTGQSVLDSVHQSIVYDLPIFLAYLSILPGMAVFFYRLEADFAEQYALFYENILDGAPLQIIDRYHREMVRVVRRAVRDIMIVQGIMNIFLFVTAPYVFDRLHIPQLYLSLFYILTVGAQIQLGFMSILALLYYIDRRRIAMYLAVAFFALNFLLSWVSIYLGPTFFGYGYAVSLLIVFTIGLFALRKNFRELAYETFMLQ